MTKIDKKDIENIKLIQEETKIGNISKIKIKKGDYEIEISSETLNSTNLLSNLTQNISDKPSEEIFSSIYLMIFEEMVLSSNHT